MNASNKSSYSAFSDVDDLVSKPVLGSDGAATWQDFKKDNSNVFRKPGISDVSTAPIVPIKRSDKLGTGLKTREEEYANEKQIRKNTGNNPMGQGYTSFKRRVDTNEVQRNKQEQLIKDRVRPENMRYFVSEETFQGWKEDYIFTTRDRGTGYYWDGMDSINTLMSKTTKRSIGSIGEEDKEKKQIDPIGDTHDTNPKKKKKKKKKKQTDLPCTIGDDCKNPFDQVTNALRRRNEIRSRPPASVKCSAIVTTIDTVALTGRVGTPSFSNKEQSEVVAPSATWEHAKDSLSGREYYFCRSTGKTCWNNPLRETTPSKNETIKDNVQLSLPKGWNSAKDPASGKFYYFHVTTGKTSWDIPL